MSYCDAYHNRDTDRILVSERDQDGVRHLREFLADYHFYFDDPKGHHRTIHGNPVSKYSTHSNKQFRKEVDRQSSAGKTIYEASVRPVLKLLEREYRTAGPANINTAFFDIEVDFNKDLGFAPVDNPFNAITAITVYQSWTEQLITLALKPRGMDDAVAERIASEVSQTTICESEGELLKVFLALIEDADVLTGWNSQFFDIPYIVGRIVKVLNKDWLRELCLWGELPKERKAIKFKKEHTVYDLIGRVHLDYLELYQKFTYNELHSYSLDAVSELEVNERKVPYEGTLDHLYNYDFKKFLEYNRQDVMLIVKMDAKLRFLSLVNQMAHENCVLMPAVLGTVVMCDNAITLEAHDLGMVRPDKDRTFQPPIYDTDDEDTPKKSKVLSVPEAEKALNSTIAGAYVADPVTGISENIFSMDLNSLYPSVIRALNISPETIYGQLKPVETTESLVKYLTEVEGSVAKAWNGRFGTIEFEKVMSRSTDNVCLVMEATGEEIIAPACQIYQLIFTAGEPLCLSANGTIFRTDNRGIVANLLTRWYDDRKAMQQKEHALYAFYETGIAIPTDLDLSDL